MISLLRSAERRCVSSGPLKVWNTFEPESLSDPLHRGFRALKRLDEVVVAPGAELEIPVGEEHEVLTYVREGALLVGKGPGEEELLRPGYVQRMSCYPRLSLRAAKESSPKGARLFLSSMKIRPRATAVSVEVKHIPFSARQGELRAIARPDAEGDALRLHQDVRLYSSLLEKGQHVVHELGAGRGAWLHLVAGQVQINDLRLETGDGAAVEDERALSLSAQGPSEILLFDLP